MIKQQPALRITKPIKPTIEILNLKYSMPYKAYDVCCDRSSPLGSPFYLRGDESRRDKVCDAYHDWFYNRVLQGKKPAAYQELLRLKELYRKHGQLRIFCWCAPKRCHTETIKQWLELTC